MKKKLKEAIDIIKGFCKEFEYKDVNYDVQDLLCRADYLLNGNEDPFYPRHEKKEPEKQLPEGIGFDDPLWTIPDGMFEKEQQNQQQVKQEFKKGDAVYDRVSFPGIEGIVWEIKTNTSQVYVIVHFGSSIAAYNTDGCRQEGAIQTLFHHDYEIELKPVEAKFEKDELVLVRDSVQGIWVVRRFAQSNNGIYSCYDGAYPEVKWRYCIKFDPEKALRVTND